MKDGGRCLTWSLVGAAQVECLLAAGHGGLHHYPTAPPPACDHPVILLDTGPPESVYCDDCGKSWS